MYRKGTFHFEKLPAEIRHLIIRHLLEPLYRYDNLSQQSLVEISIKDVDSASSGRSFFEKGIIDGLKEADRLYDNKAKATLSTDDDSDDIEESDVDRNPPLRRALAPIALFWQRLRGALPGVSVSDETEDEGHAFAHIFTEHLSRESFDERTQLMKGEILQYPHYFKGLSAAEESLIRGRYERLEKSYQWEHKIHPERSSQYTLAIKLNKPATNVPVTDELSGDDDENDDEEDDQEGNEETEAAEEEEDDGESEVSSLAPYIDDSEREKEQSRDFHMLKLIRQFSNLSAAFRLDLGTVLWANTKLHISGYTALSSGPSIFLMDRPEIVRGIKCLSLDAKYDFGSLGTDAGEGECFDVLCRYLVRYVKVAHLQINIVLAWGLQQDRLDALCSGTSKFAGLRLLRLMIVTESFEVRLQVQRRHDWNRIFLREFKEDPSLAKDYLRRAHDLILPETLRGIVRYDRVEDGMLEVGADGDVQEEFLTCASILTRL